MAKSTSQRAIEAIDVPEEVVEERGRKPDFIVKVRQPPQRDAGGRLVRSQNFTPVGAAWKQQAKDGTEFIGVKLSIPNMTFADNSFVLYPPYQEKDE